MSPRSEATHDDNLPHVGHVEVLREDVITSHSEPTIIMQQEDLAEGGEEMGTEVTNEV